MPCDLVATRSLSSRPGSYHSAAHQFLLAQDRELRQQQDVEYAAALAMDLARHAREGQGRANAEREPHVEEARAVVEATADSLRPVDDTTLRQARLAQFDADSSVQAPIAPPHSTPNGEATGVPATVLTESIQGGARDPYL